MPLESGSFLQEFGVVPEDRFFPQGFNDFGQGPSGCFFFAPGHVPEVVDHASGLCCVKKPRAGLRQAENPHGVITERAGPPDIDIPEKDRRRRDGVPFFEGLDLFGKPAGHKRFFRLPDFHGADAGPAVFGQDVFHGRPDRFSTREADPWCVPCQGVP